MWSWSVSGISTRPCFSTRGRSSWFFSAGSYSGLCLLHILWPIPGVVTKGCLGAIACPPSLLTMNPAKAEDQLRLIHYESDELCCWKPGRPQLDQCCSKYTYIMNESPAYKGHFGPSGMDTLIGSGLIELPTECCS